VNAQVSFVSAAATPGMSWPNATTCGFLGGKKPSEIMFEYLAFIDLTNCFAVHLVKTGTIGIRPNHSYEILDYKVTQNVSLFPLFPTKFMQFYVLDRSSSKAVFGSIPCTKGYFGDPCPGKWKQCRCIWDHNSRVITGIKPNQAQAHVPTGPFNVYGMCITLA
jgi:hypothetical protein